METNAEVVYNEAPENAATSEEISVQEAPIEQSQETIPQVENIKRHAYERISELQREKYQSQAETAYLRQQNAQLQQAAQATLATATNQYNEALVQKMARLKDEKIKAREENNTEAEANVDIALSLMAAEFNRAQNLIPPTFTPPAAQQSYPQQGPDYSGAVQEWANQNTWFHPASPDHDPQLRAHVDSWCNAFDNNLRQNGKADAIMSPEYLAHVNQEVNRIRMIRNQQNYQDGNLNMQQPRGNVGRVNTLYNGGGASQRQTVKLTPDQRDLARRLGVSEKDYIRHVVDDMKKQSQGGRY